MIFPEEELKRLIKDVNVIEFENKMIQFRYQFTDYQIKDINNHSVALTRKLIELYNNEYTDFTINQLRFLWPTIAGLFCRDEDFISDSFFKKSASKLGIDPNDIFMEKGAAWLISKISPIFYESDLRWAGVCCNDDHDKYIFTYVIKNDQKYEMRTFYGRIGTKPQASMKSFCKFEDADREFNKYIKSKSKKYESICSNNIYYSFAKEMVDGANELKNEETPKKEEFESWQNVRNRFKTFVGRASTLFGEYVRAIDFIEFRAKSRNDWPHVGMTDEEIERSLSTSAIGFLVLPSIKNEYIECLLKSNTKEEFLDNLNMVKDCYLALANKLGLNKLMSDTNNGNYDMSSQSHEDNFKKLWSKINEQ